MATRTKTRARPLADLEAILDDPARVAQMRSGGEWSRFSLEYTAAKLRDDADNPSASHEALEALQAAEHDSLRGEAHPSRLNLSGGPQALGWPEPGQPAPDTLPGLPALAPSAETVQKLHAAVRSQETLRVQNAVVTTSSTGADQHSVPLMLSQREPRRLVAAAGIVAQPVDGITSVDFPVFGGDTAGITAEGATKTEYDSITAGTATPQMITLFSDYTRQQILTQPNFEAKLRNVLASRVALREDQLVITAALAVTGIQTVDMAAADPDLVLEAASLIASGDLAALPNLFVFHPDDTAALFGADAFNANRVSDARVLDFRLHGMVGYPSSHVPTGEILVGAWPAASRFVIGLPPTFLIDATSGIKTNVITTLLEEAVDLAVDEPTGFCHLRPAP